MSDSPEKMLVIPAHLIEVELKPHVVLYILNAPEYQLKPEDYGFYHNCRMDDAAKVNGYKNYDTSLPQKFVDHVMKLTGKSIYGHAVWSVDKVGSCFGDIVPVTREGKMILDIYNHIKSQQ